MSAPSCVLLLPPIHLLLTSPHLFLLPLLAPPLLPTRPALHPAAGTAVLFPGSRLRLLHTTPPRRRRAWPRARPLPGSPLHARPTSLCSDGSGVGLRGRRLPGDAARLQPIDRDPRKARQLRARHGGVLRPPRPRSHHRQLHLPVRAQGRRGAQAVGRGPQGAWAAMKTGFRWDAYTASSMMEMYTMLDRADVAWKLFDKMPRRVLVLWNMMIRCYVRCGRYASAFALAEEMERSGLTLDRVTLVSAVTACSTAGDLSLGRRIHDYMDGVFGFSLPLANALLDMYIKNGCLEEAVKLFEQMPVRNIISWTIPVSGYALAGQLDKARVHFYQCTEKDLILWTAMINACVQHGCFEEAVIVSRHVDATD